MNIRVPLLFVFGFFAIFVMGGLTGVMLASVPLNTQLHDTYFVVAHFHHVLIGGAVFPLIGAIYYWFPKFTGRMPNETLGRVSFAFLLTGFFLVFFPMHFLGLAGMPRRVYTYVAEAGWGSLNLLATIGAFVISIGVLFFVINVIKSLISGQSASRDPWGADTLEWMADSPPRPYNFQNIPVVEGRHAMWERTQRAPVVTGLHTKVREMLCTTIHDASPEHRYTIVEPSIFPFLLSLVTGASFIGFAFTPWSIPIGMTASFAVLFGWFWSNSTEHRPPYTPAKDNPVFDEEAALV
jgi:cytochrome c oxidase subunit 1